MRRSWPGPFGAHNWHAMSFNPKTGSSTSPRSSSHRASTTRRRLVDWQSPNAQVDDRGGYRLGEGHPGRHRRARSCLGSRQAEEGLGGAAGRLLESGHDDDGRRPRLPGPRGRRFRCLRRNERRDALEHAWARHLRAADHLRGRGKTVCVDPRRLGWRGCRVRRRQREREVRVGLPRTDPPFVHVRTRRRGEDALLEPPVVPEAIVPADFAIDDKLATKGAACTSSTA